MAWNPKTHVGVLSFRGTASMANVLADLQVRQLAADADRFGKHTQRRAPLLCCACLHGSTFIKARGGARLRGRGGKDRVPPHRA